MKLKKITIENFRNIENSTLEFSADTTLIYGDNAERSALYVCTFKELSPCP